MKVITEYKYNNIVKNYNWSSRNIRHNINNGYDQTHKLFSKGFLKNLNSRNTLENLWNNNHYTNDQDGNNYNISYIVNYNDYIQDTEENNDTDNETETDEE